MKTRTLMISAAIAAVLNCAPVNAQLLGGGVSGGLGGTLSGGARDMSAVTRGDMNGSLGAELDTGTLRDRAVGTTGRISNRARNTVDGVREHGQSKVGEARGTARTTARTGVGAASEAAGAANGLGSSVAAAGSLASAANVDGSEIAGAANATATKQLVAQPEIGNVETAGALDTAARAAGGATGDVEHQNLAATSSLAGATRGVAQSHESEDSDDGADSNRQLVTGGGALAGAGAADLSATEAPVAPMMDASAQGGASGNASASKKGVSASSAASTSAQGSASVSHR